MDSSNPNEALLSQEPVSTEQTNEIAVPTEYIDDEKGKMNTLEVDKYVVNHQQFCVNLMKGIAGTGSLAIPFAFNQVSISGDG